MSGPVHERIRQVLVELLLADPEGSAIDYGRDVISQGKGGHGKHGTRSVAPPSPDSRAVEYADAFRRLVELAELDLAVLKGTVQLQPRRVGSGGRVSSELARDRKRRIVGLAAYRGRSHEWVALAEGCSADLVRKTRTERGLDSFGFKPAESPVQNADGEVRPKGRGAARLTGRDLPEHYESDDPEGV